MLTSLTHVLEHSLASVEGHVNTEERPEQTYAERTAAIRALPNPLKRYGALCIHSFVGHAPLLAENIQAHLLARRGLSRIAEGAEAVVYRQDQDGVIKAFKRTWDMSEAQRTAFLEEHAHSEMRVAQYLGTSVVPHAYDIGPHPISGERIVRADQSFVHFSKEDSIFPSVTTTVDSARLEAIESRHPGAIDALADMAQAALDMHAAIDYLPDTHGQDNLVVGSVNSGPPEILLLDTHLARHNNSHLNFYPHILGQMHDLIRAAHEI